MSDTGSSQEASRDKLPASAMKRAINALFVPRSFALLLVVSIVFGSLYALTMLPLSLIRGGGEFWKAPEGTVGGSASANDMIDYIVGYLYLVKSPWTLPVLFAPNLGAPVGTNVFWLDVVPWVSLTGKVLHTVTGTIINPFGYYLFACLALPGAAMTTLLAVAGQRGLIAAIAGTTIANATPYLLFHWGHMPLLGHFWIILGLALYLATVGRPRDWWITTAWLVALPTVLLTNIYMFVMFGACWSAALAQKRLDGNVSNSRVLVEAVTAMGVVACSALLTGMLTSDLASAGTVGCCVYSMNLASPLVPQMSGLIPPLAHYRVGMNPQYEGFAYLGAGVLLLLAVSLRGWAAWLWQRARYHLVLISVLVCFLLFALSNKLYLGSHLIFEVPLPQRILFALGTFRSSGRFFWPIGYAIVAGSIVMILRWPRPVVSLTVLAIASILQLIDVEPLREAVAASARLSAPPVFDRERAAAIVAQSRAVMVFPSFGCIDNELAIGSVAQSQQLLSQRLLLQQENVELELITARMDLPINSVYNARLSTDCAAEGIAKSQTLRSGTLYVYLTPFVPTADQLHRFAPDEICSTLDSLHYCLLPDISPTHRSN